MVSTITPYSFITVFLRRHIALSSVRFDNDSWCMEHHKEYVLAHRAKNVTGLMMRKNMSMKSIHYFSKV